MNRIEDRLTSLLTRSTEAVDVEADLDRVLDSSPAVLALDDRRGRSRRRSAILLAGAAATATIAVATYAVSRSGEDVDVRNPATSPVDDGGAGDPAEENSENPDTPPRFLITADGWELESSGADYGGDADAEAFYGDSSGRTIPIWRYRREDLEAWVNDADAEHLDIEENFSDPLGTTHTATGQEITLYEMTGDGWAAAWYEGDYGFLADTNTNSATDALEYGADGEYIPQDEFTEILGTVELVDEETWLAALPDDHATNEGERSSAVENALQNVPLPDGVTADTILADMGDLTGPETQVEIEVLNAVTCGWIDAWIAADEADDTEVQQEAAEALASSDQWPVLTNIDAFVADDIREVADAMAADERIQATTGEGPVWGPTQGQGYLRHIGCLHGWD